MTSLSIHTVVVGAGVVGLACAARLAATGREVLVLERNLGIGEEVSSRNSEVIHGGIYYKTGSVKARLCVQGKKKLYQYCEQFNVRFTQPGKLIVATEDQEIPALEQLIVKGLANGVDDLVWLSENESRSVEPSLQCVGAIFSPSTGIIDSHGLMLSLQGELESSGGMISFASVAEEIKPGDTGLEISVLAEGSMMTVIAEELVNCAGLGAVELANQTQGVDSSLWPQAQFSKGNYFRLKGASPFSHLIYPAPVAGGLGIHLALDIDGNARFGPDVEAVDDAKGSLEVDPKRAADFYQRIRRYWPDLQDQALSPDYAGIRPKIGLEGSQATDFSFMSEKHHQIPGLVHCLGIESPGLTSSLAIADEVISLLDGEKKV